MIYDSNGSLHARYIYDTWGRSISITDANGNAITSQTDIANFDPFRYRGYYYDTETEMYYYISRYYDTAILRFINAHAVDYIDASGTVLRCNMYSYCENDAVNSIDSFGTSTYILYYDYTKSNGVYKGFKAQAKKYWGINYRCVGSKRIFSFKSKTKFEKVWNNLKSKNDIDYLYVFLHGSK